MSLTNKEKQKLKSRAHALNPVVLVGQHGFTQAVQKEIERALHDHELIKIRIQSEDREARKTIFLEISTALQAELVQVIGRIGVFYRKKMDG